jgi:hypothetical protein
MGVGHSHDHADHVDDALTTSAAGIRAVKISLLALAATAIAQLAVVALSGSVALFADTVHNFCDALTQSRCGSRSRSAGARPLGAIRTGPAGPKTWPACSSSR